MSDLTTLPGGGKWHSYSGIMTGGPTLPATVELVKIPSTGLRDSYVKVVPFYGQPVTAAAGDALGIKIFINQVAVFEAVQFLTVGGASGGVGGEALGTLELFVPQQSELQILSLNTNNNTLQNRGCMVLGWWL